MEGGEGEREGGDGRGLVRFNVGGKTGWMGETLWEVGGKMFVGGRGLGRLEVGGRRRGIRRGDE